MGTLENKVHPRIGTLCDMLDNADFYEHQIRNPDDPFVRQLAQEAQYLAGQFVPFSARNAMQQVQRGQTRAAVLNSIGITPAPKEETRTAADLRMSQEARRRARGELTPEEVERQHKRRGVTDALRAHDGSASAKLRAAMESGAIRPTGIRSTISNASIPPDVERFTRLPLEEAMHVDQLGTPAEQRRYLPVLVAKMHSAKQRGVAIPSGALVHAGH